MGVPSVTGVPLTAAVTAALSALLVAVGAGLAWFPAGLIVGGIEGLAGAWVGVYVWARQAERTSHRRT